ncbi:MAG: class I SAM-dependent methyltransferase [Rhodothermaceae bacterium]
MSKEFWNKVFSEKEFAYGVKPNKFFESELKKLIPGKILLPAEGEGRNAVFAASLGWDVTAFDTSDQAKTKALQLSSEYNLSINYLICSLEEVEIYRNQYDAIGLSYVHPSPALRKVFHNTCTELLKPGGKLIFEGFSKEQLNFNSGGPKDYEFLFSEEDLKADFEKMSSLETEQKLVVLDEGKYHQGKASVIRVTGTK